MKISIEWPPKVNYNLQIFWSWSLCAKTYYFPPDKCLFVHWSAAHDIEWLFNKKLTPPQATTVFCCKNFGIVLNNLNDFKKAHLQIGFPIISWERENIYFSSINTRFTYNYGVCTYLYSYGTCYPHAIFSCTVPIQLLSLPSVTYMHTL